MSLAFGGTSVPRGGIRHPAPTTSIKVWSTSRASLLDIVQQAIDDVKRKNVIAPIVPVTSKHLTDLVTDTKWCAPSEVLYEKAWAEGVYAGIPICLPEWMRATVWQTEKHGKQGDGMSDYSYEALQLVDEKIEAARIAKEAINLEAAIAAYGEDTYAPGTVFTFTYTVENNTTPNQVAFLKTESEKWAVTGDRYLRTWDQTVRWLLTDGVTIRFADLTKLS